MRALGVAALALGLQGCVGIVGLGEANYVIQQVALVSPQEAKSMGVTLISHQCIQQINSDCENWHKKGAGPGDTEGWIFKAHAKRGPYNLNPEFVIAGKDSCEKYHDLYQLRAPKDYQISSCSGPVWYRRG